MRIFCGGTQCGEYLGEVGPSTVSMKARPVWRIQPGWRWLFPPGSRDHDSRGVLVYDDPAANAENRLGIATFGLVGTGRVLIAGGSSGVLGVARETDLPVVVRCPRCHRFRYVTPDVVLRPLIRA